MREFKINKNVIIPTNNSTINEFGEPDTVSGFFKFSRSNYNVFAENLGMKIAYLLLFVHILMKYLEALQKH